MIPYFTIQPLHLGLLTLYPWGFFVALGFIAGALVSTRYLKNHGEDQEKLWDALPWLMLVAVVGARLGNILFYDPYFYLSHPKEIFFITHGGLASTGGLLAAGVFGTWWLRKKCTSRTQRWNFLNAIALGFPVGEAIGRLGCFVVHEHPGLVTTFFLGVQFPDGVIRHDLGLYLSLNALILAGVLRLYKGRRAFLVAVGYYGVTRFMLDFLRIGDTRYLGLTPAQYLCITILSGLIIVLAVDKKRAFLKE